MITCATACSTCPRETWRRCCLSWSRWRSPAQARAWVPPLPASPPAPPRWVQNATGWPLPPPRRGGRETPPPPPCATRASGPRSLQTRATPTAPTPRPPPPPPPRTVRRRDGALSPVFRSRLTSPTAGTGGGGLSPLLSPVDGGRSRAPSPLPGDMFSDDESRDARAAASTLATARRTRSPTSDSGEGGTPVAAAGHTRVRALSPGALSPGGDGVAFSPDGRPLSPGAVDRGFFAVTAGLEGLICSSPPPAESARGGAARRGHAAAAPRAPPPTTTTTRSGRPAPIAPPCDNLAPPSPLGPAPPPPGKASVGATLDLVEALTCAAAALTGFSPDDRAWALRRGLADINRELDAAAAVGVGAPAWPLAARGGGFGGERVVRLAPDRATVLASRDKAPFLLVAEVVVDGGGGEAAGPRGDSESGARAATLGPPPGLCAPPGLPPRAPTLASMGAPPAPSTSTLDAQLAAALDGLRGRGPIVRVVLQPASRPPSARGGGDSTHTPPAGDAPPPPPLRVKLVPVAPVDLTQPLSPTAAPPAADAPPPPRRARHRRVPSDEALSAVASAAAAAAAGRVGGAGALAAALQAAGSVWPEEGEEGGGGGGATAAAAAPAPPPTTPSTPPPTPAATAAALALYGEPWRDVEAAVRSASPHGRIPGWALRRAIVKSGDDCRLELLAAQLIGGLDAAFSAAGLPLRLRPYGVLPAGGRTALIEAVPDAVSIHALKASLPPNTSLASHFFTAHPRGTQAGAAAQRRFVESMAAYSLATYFFSVRDRHNGNILLTADGAIVHIDYGFILGASPGGVSFETAPFKLTRELLEVMDSDASGSPSPAFDAYKLLLVSGFLAARRAADRLVGLVEVAAGPGGPLAPRGAAAPRAAKALSSRFLLGVPDHAAVAAALGLVADSLDAWRTRQYDFYQRTLNGIL